MELRFRESDPDRAKRRFQVEVNARENHMSGEGGGY